MPTVLFFLIHLILGYVAWLLCFSVYLLPRLRAMGQFEAQRAIATLPQTTLNTLVMLEDAFIAAYLVGVRDFSNGDLRVMAARIMGIESDHRTLARVVGGDIAPQNGGPLQTITCLQGVAEPINPPNNNRYERTQCWGVIGHEQLGG